VVVLGVGVGVKGDGGGQEEGVEEVLVIVGMVEE
jgi:hypothetical protein